MPIVRPTEFEIGGSRYSIYPADCLGVISSIEEWVRVQIESSVASLSGPIADLERDYLESIRSVAGWGFGAIWYQRLVRTESGWLETVYQSMCLHRPIGRDEFRLLVQECPNRVIGAVEEANGIRRGGTSTDADSPIVSQRIKWPNVIQKCLQDYHISPENLPYVRLSFLSAMAGAEAKKSSGSGAIGYKAQFEHVWRKRFEHLDPESREMAVAAEWARYCREKKK